MSTFRVDVVPITLEPHPNADTLSLVRVFGWNVVVKTADWQGVTQAAYVPPDSVVPTTDGPFAFLYKEGRVQERVTVRRFRSVYSQGLLVPAPDGSKIGDDVAALLKVEHYEPPISTRGGEAEKPPPGFRPVYDVESYNRYGSIMVEGEEIVLSEKLHGANARFCWDVAEARFCCGSRTEWKKDDLQNLWWIALRAHPELQGLLVAHPELTIYGEVYGQVQDLKYGVKSGVRIRVFDAWHVADARWLNDAELAFMTPYNVLRVPILYRGPFSDVVVRQHAIGQSTMPGTGHIREGCVFRPVVERQDFTLLSGGRVQLKLVSDEYLERCK